MTQDENGMVDNTMDGAEYSGEEDTTNVIGGASTGGEAGENDGQTHRKPDRRRTGRCSRDSGIQRISVKNICRAKSRFRFSKNINFSMEEGEYVAIMGPSWFRKNNTDEYCRLP